MQSPHEYLTKTESAVRKLFDGINEYTQVLRDSPVPVFVTSLPPGPEFDAQFEAWIVKHTAQNAAAEGARQAFKAEGFALDTLCGAVLQVAEKALEYYSTGGVVPLNLETVVKPTTKKFCVGRIVRGVPLGLVVYAARNQHTHFNEPPLREPSASVFERLASGPEFGTLQAFRDPAFDLQNPAILSFAANVTALLGWRDYEQYIGDMHHALDM